MKVEMIIFVINGYCLWYILNLTVLFFSSIFHLNCSKCASFLTSGPLLNCYSVTYLRWVTLDFIKLLDNDD